MYIEFRPEEKYQFPNKNLNLDYSMERLEQKKAKEKICEVCYLKVKIVFLMKISKNKCIKPTIFFFKEKLFV